MHVIKTKSLKLTLTKPKVPYAAKINSLKVRSDRTEYVLHVDNHAVFDPAYIYIPGCMSAPDIVVELTGIKPCSMKRNQSM